MATGKVMYAKQGSTCVIRLVGTVRHTISSGFDALIEELFAGGEVTDYVLDLCDAEHIDSTTLGLMAKIARRQIRSLGERPVIVSSNESINRLLDSMGFDAAFDIVERPAGAGPAFRDIAALPQDRQQRLRMVLDAHRALIELNGRNAETFQGVVEALERDVDGD